MRSWVERVPLRTGSEPPRFARLREPNGGDELALDGVDTRAAMGLLERLLDAPTAAGELSASDRDGLLAALHRGLWGDRIVSSLECSACGVMYDLAFDLSALQRRLEDGREAARVVAPRTLEDADGARFRLPTAGEEDAAAQLGAVSGRASLAAAIAGEERGTASDLDERLEALAPLIDVDLKAACTECDHAALARFDIQSFVLQRLLDERQGVLSEIHALASAYGWSLGEILELPRSLRRSLTERLADDRARSR
jgi:hypothetical protein